MRFSLLQISSSIAKSMVKVVWVIRRIFRKNALESPKSSCPMDSSNNQMLSGSRHDGVVNQLGSKLENHDSFHEGSRSKLIFLHFRSTSIMI
ncbi:hypothetical protein M0R45_015960 [Rubus argutus]|uniref:Uncharacterized protein n=1 Tax=Rubus argutus TaxID=59490 RepID=A0AAW1XUU6_RUBAR